MRNFVLALAAAACPSALAAQVIDILQPSFGNGGAFVSSATNLNGTWTGQAVAQTFTAVSEESVGAGFYMFNFARDANTTYRGAYRISLWADAPSSFGAVLASSDFSYSWRGGERMWADAFWSPISLAIGQTYWLSLVQVGNPDYDGSLAVGNGFNPYLGGMASIQMVGGGIDCCSNGPFTPNSYGIPHRLDLDQADLAFRTWTTTVPEPSSFVLISSGLCLLGVLAWRRRRAYRRI